MISWSTVIKGACTAAYRIAVLLLLSGILINLEVLVEAQIASALNTRAIAQMFDELYMQPWEMAP